MAEEEAMWRVMRFIPAVTKRAGGHEAGRRSRSGPAVTKRAGGFRRLAMPRPRARYGKVTIASAPCLRKIIPVCARNDFRAQRIALTIFMRS
jgi:hypothetical protein